MSFYEHDGRRGRRDEKGRRQNSRNWRNERWEDNHAYLRGSDDQSPVEKETQQDGNLVNPEWAHLLTSVQIQGIETRLAATIEAISSTDEPLVFVWNGPEQDLIDSTAFFNGWDENPTPEVVIEKAIFEGVIGDLCRRSRLRREDYYIQIAGHAFKAADQYRLTPGCMIFLKPI